jgi:hypothetical protein
MRPNIVAYVLLAAIAIILPAGYLESGTPDIPDKDILTNQDVVKLSKAGVGEAAIIQKINQAARANFEVDAGSLTKLQAEGVTQSIIAAMSRKASVQAREEAIRNYQEKQPKLTVELEVPSGTIELKGLDGYKSDLHVSRSLLFSSTHGIKGAKALQVISDAQPTVVITTIEPQEDADTFFLVKLNSHNDERLYKMGSIRQVGGAKYTDSVPKENTQVKLDVEHKSMLVWRLTPKEALKPGEYAVMVFEFGIDDWKIFDFGVN